MLKHCRITRSNYRTIIADMIKELQDSRATETAPIIDKGIVLNVNIPVPYGDINNVVTVEVRRGSGEEVFLDSFSGKCRVVDRKFVHQATKESTVLPSTDLSGGGAKW